MAGILYFNQFRQGLIDARVQSLTTQAHIIAAAIAGSATVDTGSIVIDPDSLSDTLDEARPDADQLSGLDFPINPETAGPILRRLLANTTVRARIVDPEGNLVVDSRFLYSRGDIIQSELPPLAVDAGQSPQAALGQLPDLGLFLRLSAAAGVWARQWQGFPGSRGGAQRRVGESCPPQ